MTSALKDFLYGRPERLDCISSPKRQRGFLTSTSSRISHDERSVIDGGEVVEQEKNGKLRCMRIRNFFFLSLPFFGPFEV